MKSISLLIPVVALLAGCESTPSTAPAPAVPNRFELADTNKDGKLSELELSNGVDSTVFAARDRDKNGGITASECIPEEMKDFKASDTNKDGMVTYAEFSAHARKSPERAAGFKEADTNKDGFLDRAEALAYYAARE